MADNASELIGRLAGTCETPRDVCALVCGDVVHVQILHGTHPPLPSNNQSVNRFFTMAEFKTPPTYSESKDNVSDPERDSSPGEITPYTGRVDEKEYGHVRRGLKSRHVQFIAIGGIIGTGLFVGSGAALVRAGPLSILLAYSIVGTVIYSLILAIGEVRATLPDAARRALTASR